ncbi:MAG: hypothetical protein H8D45_21020 [Bacteroidetes bacterium]|nr:hypothetical protein [Bacteroidota bacterium]
MDESYIFTENYLYRDGIAAAGSNPADEDNTYDYDLTTFWESVNPAPAPPLCYINYQFPATYDIDYVWLKSSNLGSYTVWEWTGAAWQQIGGARTPDANGISLEDITPALGDPDRLRLEFTSASPGVIYIYEVFFFKLLHTLQNSDDSFASNIIVTPVDRIGGSYMLVDGSQTSYRGAKIYRDITFEYEFTPQASRDSLYDIYYSTTYGIRPPVVVYPNPDEYPEEIYRCVFERIDFPFGYTIPYKGSGFSGTLNFKEY